jgi:hypothetical protein
MDTYSWKETIFIVENLNVSYLCFELQSKNHWI